MAWERGRDGEGWKEAKEGEIEKVGRKLSTVYQYFSAT